MGMREEAMKELARRELARRQEATNGTPQIVEEMHPEISTADRAIVKNFSSSPEKSANYLKKHNPQLDTRVWDGRVLVKGKNEKEWRPLDPDAEGFDGLAEFGRDVLDVGYDVASGIAEGLATAGGAVGGALAGMGVGALPAAMLTSGAASAVSEAARQKLGQWAGIDQEVSGSDVLAAGTIGGLLPGVPTALKKTALGAKGATKGALKFLGGVPEEAIQRMQKPGAEELISKIEKDGAYSFIEKKQEALYNKLSQIEKEQLGRVEKLRGQLDIADDDQLRAVLNEEITSLNLKAQQNEGFLSPSDLKKREAIGMAIEDIDATAPVRKELADIGAGDVAEVQKRAFPESIASEDIEGLAPELNDKLQSTLSDLRYQYETLGEIGEDVSLGNLRKLYDDKIATLRSSQLPQDRQVADLLEKDLQSKLSKVQSVETTGGLYPAQEVVGQMGEKESFKTTARIKKMFADSAYNNKKVQGDIKQVEQAGFLSNMHKQAERTLNEDMMKSSMGLKGELDPEYVKIQNAIKESGRLFGTPRKAESTISGAMKSDVKLAEIQKIDDIAGTNYAKMIKDTAVAKELTGKGIDQMNMMKQASAYVTGVADQSKSVEEKLLEALGPKVKDKKDFVNTIKMYKNKSNMALNKEIDTIDDALGEEAGQATKEIINDLDLAAIFGDATKTGLDVSADGQASNTLRGTLQSLAWQTPAGAGGAQIAGSVGKAIGEKLPIKKLLRKALPIYMEKKQALKSFDDATKKELEKKIMNTVLSNRDLVRELSKKLMQDRKGD